MVLGRPSRGVPGATPQRTAAMGGLRERLHAENRGFSQQKRGMWLRKGRRLKATGCWGWVRAELGGRCWGGGGFRL